MRINITIEEAKEIIYDHITKHYILTNTENNDPNTAITFINKTEKGDLEPEDNYFFTAWIEMEFGD